MQREGKSYMYYFFRCLAEAVLGGKYTRQVRYVRGSNLNKMVTRNVRIIDKLSYAQLLLIRRYGSEQGVARDVSDVG